MEAVAGRIMSLIEPRADNKVVSFYGGRSPLISINSLLRSDLSSVKFWLPSKIVVIGPNLLAWHSLARRVWRLGQASGSSRLLGHRHQPTKELRRLFRRTRNNLRAGGQF
jgi:hypothetical protein